MSAFGPRVDVDNVVISTGDLIWETSLRVPSSEFRFVLMESLAFVHWDQI
jgi:hypothetical protein